MIDFYEVIKASEGIAVADEFAALWGRKVAGGYTVETYTGALPVTLEGTVKGSLVSYKIWGNTGGVGVKKTNLAEGEQLLRNASMGTDGTIVTTSSNFAFRLIPVVEGREYTIINIYDAETSTSSNFYAFFEELPQIGSVSYNERRYSFKTPSQTFVAPITGYLATSDYFPMYEEQHLNLIPLEVYEGNASPYYLPIVSYNKFKEVHKDTVSIAGIEWNVLGYDHDEVYKADGTLAQHTVTIQAKQCIAPFPFNVREALFVFPDGLAAGSYTFTIKAHKTVPSDINKSITFTLTQAIPEGGQLAVNQANNVSFTTGTISSYASSSAANPIETVAMNEGSTGTSLGDVTNSVTGNTNSIMRALLGSNRWSTAAIRQFLNSDKAAGQVWSPQTAFDRPPSWAANSTGFLYNVDPDFVSVIGSTKKRTARAISFGGVYEDSIEKVFLLSMTEVYAGENSYVAEGSPYAFYENYSDSSTPSTGADNNRRKYYNSLLSRTQWWLRSPSFDPTNDTGVGYIDVDGSYASVEGDNVQDWLAPACCIILDDIDSNPWLRDRFLISSTDTPIYIGREALEKDEYVDSENGKIYRMVDGALTPTDPPEPLPQIPTSAGSTTISYGGGTSLERKEVHKDTVTINGIEWDILGYDHDEVYKEDGTRASHTVTIQTHDCVDNLQFDAREALFAFPDGLAAGSYTFTIKAHTWVSSDVNKSITFTLTQAIPKGGQLVVSQAYNASFTTGNISSYVSSSATEPIETVKMNEGDTGTSLGDVTDAIVDNTNSCRMALLGSNRWSTSAIRQYLNSDKAVGTFWEPQTIFDRPPSWVATTAGFLFGADPEFVTVLGKVKKVTALNDVLDGDGSVETDEKVFLISRTEAYMGDEIAGGEGKAYAYYSNYSDLAAAGTGSDTNRIKYRAGAAKYWWLRSPYVGYACYVRAVSPSGALNGSYATFSLGIAPACCIILDDIDSNPWLQDHFLKPTGAQPEKVEFKYKYRR